MILETVFRVANWFPK